MGKDKKAKLKIPKKIGGVKIPKELRKKAKSAVALAESPLAREVIAAGLAAAAAVIAEKVKKREAAPASDEPPRQDRSMSKDMGGARDAFAAMAREVALGFAAAYADGANGKATRKDSNKAAKSGEAAH